MTQISVNSFRRTVVRQCCKFVPNIFPRVFHKFHAIITFYVYYSSHLMIYVSLPDENGWNLLEFGFFTIWVVLRRPQLASLFFFMVCPNFPDCRNQTVLNVVVRQHCFPPPLVFQSPSLFQLRVDPRLSDSNKFFHGINVGNYPMTLNCYYLFDGQSFCFT